MTEQSRPTEGNLKAPQRHTLDWKAQDFWDEELLTQEMERQFDICHGCRRCFSLCDAFPTLFDAIDDSESMDLQSVPKEVYWRVVDQCYLCDLCFMTKCPYTPPHEFNMDFPHLMLRAKAVRHRLHGDKLRDRVLTSTDTVGRLAGIPVVAQAVNAANSLRPARVVLEKTLQVHRDAPLPKFTSRSARRRLKASSGVQAPVHPSDKTRGQLALFVTCYGNRNMPSLVEDLWEVFRHNDLGLQLVPQERCCGMPKLETGDLAAIDRLKEFNVPRLARLVDEGWDLTAPVPSCVLMYKQELPMLYPNDKDVAKVARAFYDPFEYLALRHEQGLLKTDFQRSLGSVVCHASCHQRVQNIGPKTRDILRLVPDTEVELIQRCSGHDGTYAVKSETYAAAMKIGRPVFRKIAESKPAYYGSDCPLAGDQLEHGLGKTGDRVTHPISMLRLAYGI